MCCKILTSVFIVVALASAIAASIGIQQGLTSAVFVSRFFEVMIPVLAVGALVKYLLCGGSCKCGDDCSCQKK